MSCGDALKRCNPFVVTTLVVTTKGFAKKSQMSLDNIVRCRIHPGIGVARIGNSTDEYFIGPEAPGEVPSPQGGFKDLSGRIKRQVARFLQICSRVEPWPKPFPLSR